MVKHGRRAFLKSAAATGVAVTALGTQRASATPLGPQAANSPDREYWVSIVRRLADPVLENLSAGTLVARMPVGGPASRRAVTHLEAVDRLLTGMAPWLELGPRALTAGVAS